MVTTRIAITLFFVKSTTLFIKNICLYVKFTLHLWCKLKTLIL